MAKRNAPKHTPKEQATFGASDEVKTFDSALKRGSSIIYIDENKKKAKELALKDPEFKQALEDFIFGRSDENPMEEINEEFKKKTKTLSNKKYKNVGIVSLYEDDKLNMLDKPELDGRVHTENTENTENTEDEDV